jgi:hypothetical protein
VIQGGAVQDHPCLLPRRQTNGERCWHSATVLLDRRPDLDWYDICAHLKCTERDNVGWVDPRPNRLEVVDINKGTAKLQVCRAYEIKRLKWRITPSAPIRLCNS